MGFLKLNRFGHVSGMVFDPEQILEQACAAFPEIKVVPGDQLALAADRAATLGAADLVVETLRRNEKTYGPALAFEIPCAGGVIQGRARRYDVTFLFADPLPADWHKRLLAFLQGLGHGTLEGAEEVAESVQ